MIGLHLANRSNTNAQRVATLCNDFVDLHLFPEHFAAIRQFNPNARFHVRWMTPKGPLPEMGDIYRDVLDWWRMWGSYVSTFRVGNEHNLENPGTSYMDWQETLAHLLKVQIPNISYYLAAPSPGVSGFEQDVAASAKLALAYPGHISGLDAHAYGSPEEVANVLAIYRKYWDGPLNVTECNFGAGRVWNLLAYAQSLPDYVEIAKRYKISLLAFFIWEWDNPDMILPTTVNIKDTPMEIAIRDYVEETVDEATLEQLSRQNALLTQALVAFRQGKFTGADGIDGLIVALTGKPLDFIPSYPKN